MASKLFIFDSFKQYIQEGVIDLDTDTLQVALVSSAQVTSYSVWVANTAYIVGDIIVPTVDNGHRYVCVTAGTSHLTTEPSWPVVDSAQIADNTVTWEEYGGALADNTVWADASANELAAGDGYATGGETITNSQVTYDGKVATWDADDVSWVALTKTMRYAYIYKDGAVGAITDPLIGYILLDTTPQDVSVAAVDFSIRWNASGVTTLT